MLKARYAAGCETEFDERRIKYAFHDIDGTHSLIRNWPPVMSAVLNDVIERGLAPDFDSDENTRRLIGQCGTRPLEETDRFCVESAGMSALTQMEWAIRRAVEEGRVAVACDRNDNSLIIRRIWQGEERFDDIPETPEMLDMLSVYTPRLFKLNRTDSLQVGEPFVPRPIEMPDLLSERAFPDRYHVVVRISRKSRWRLVEEYGPGCYEETPEGDCLFSTGFTDREHLLSWILSFRGDAELLEPLELREELAKIGEIIRQKHHT